MKRGFTLVELLVVISIIVILVAILVPSLEKAMSASQRSKCGSNLHAVGRGLATYLNDSKSRSYPGSGTEWSLFGKRGDTLPGSNNLHQTDLYDSHNRPLNPYLGVTSKGSEVKVAQCPSDIGDGDIDPDGATQTSSTSTTTTTSNDPSGTVFLDPVVAPTTTTTTTTTTTGQGGKNCTNVYNAQGNSYASMYWATYYGMDGVFGGSKAQASSLKPPASKVMAGDTPMLGNRVYSTDRRHRWHGSDKTTRSFNLLFADSHAEFYVFKNNDAGTPVIESLAYNAPGDPARGYW